jgi:hypothetical protein
MPSFPRVGGRRWKFAPKRAPRRFPGRPLATSHSTTWPADLAETVAAGEQLDVLYAAVANPSETVPWSEAVGALASFVASPAETVSFAEALTAQMIAIQGLAESMSRRRAARRVADLPGGCRGDDRARRGAR